MYNGDGMDCVNEIISQLDTGGAPHEHLQATA
jgi:hypothetical protein